MAKKTNKQNLNRIVAWLTLEDLSLAGRIGKLSGGATAFVNDVEYYFTEDSKYHDEEPLFVNAKFFTEEELENARLRYQAARCGAPVNDKTAYILDTLSSYGGFLEHPVKLICNEEDSGDEENPGRSIVYAYSVYNSGATFHDQYGSKYTSKEFTVDNEEIILKYCDMLNE